MTSPRDARRPRNPVPPVSLPRLEPERPGPRRRLVSTSPERVRLVGVLPTAEGPRRGRFLDGPRSQRPAGDPWPGGGRRRGDAGQRTADWRSRHQAAPTVTTSVVLARAWVVAGGLEHPRGKISEAGRVEDEAEGAS
jgi:hypothetical protein